MVTLVADAALTRLRLVGVPSKRNLVRNLEGDAFRPQRLRSCRLHASKFLEHETSLRGWEHLGGVDQLLFPKGIQMSSCTLAGDVHQLP